MSILAARGRELGRGTRAKVLCTRWMQVLLVLAFAVTVIPAWAGATSVPGGNAVFDDGGIRPDGLLAWKTNHPLRSYSFPVESDGRLFVIDRSSPNVVRAFDAVSGEEIWNFTRADGNMFEREPPEVDGDVLYVSGYRIPSANLYALDARTGTEVWNNSKGTGGYMYQPVYSNGMLYVVGTDAKFYAFSAATGTEIWNCSLKYGGFPFRPVVNGGLAYVSSQNVSTNYTLYAIDLSARNERWNKTGYNLPVVANGVVYAARPPVTTPWTTSLSALNAMDGHVIWDLQVPGQFFTNPVIANGDIYIPNGLSDGSVISLYRVDAATGTLIWKQDTPTSSDTGICGISYANGIIYWYFMPASLTAFNFRATDAITGSELWRFAIAGIGTSTNAPPRVANGSVYISFKDLYAFGIPAAAFHTDSLHTGVFDSRGALPQNDLLWKYGTGGPVRSSPAVMKGSVYIGSDDGNLYSFDAGSGSKRWNFTTGGPVRSSPAVYADMVFAGSNDGKIYSLFASNGTKRWEYATGGTVTSSPVVRDGLVFAGSADHKVYALDISDGTKKWDYLTDDAVGSSPAVAFNDTGLQVFTRSRNGTLYMLNATTGTEYWNITTPGGGEFASPTVHPNTMNKGVPDRIVFGSNDGNVTFLDPVTMGRAAYATGGNVTSTPAVKDRTVYAGSDDGFLYSLDLDIVTINWRHGTGGRIASSPAVANGVVYVGSDDHRLHAISSDTGDEAWTYLTGGNVTSSPAVANGVVYVGSDDGSVYAIGRLSPPRVDSITPTSGVRGTTVTVTSLTGENFQVGDTVVLEAAGCPSITMTDVMYSPTKITGKFVIPNNAPARYRNVTVTNSAGESGVRVNAFRVKKPAPVVASISPAKHRHDGKLFSVNVTGTGFQPGIPGTRLILWKTTMTSNITASNVTVKSGLRLSGRFRIPTNAQTGLYRVTVLNPDGQSGTKPRAFEVLT